MHKTQVPEGHDHVVRNVSTPDTIGGLTWRTLCGNAEGYTE